MEVSPHWGADSAHPFAFLCSILLLGLPEPSSTTRQVGPAALQSNLHAPLKQNRDFCTIFWSQGVFLLGSNCLFQSKSYVSSPLSTDRGDTAGGEGGRRDKPWGKSSATRLLVVESWLGLCEWVLGPLGLCIKSLYCTSRATSPQRPTTLKLCRKWEPSPHAPKQSGP